MDFWRRECKVASFAVFDGLLDSIGFEVLFYETVCPVMRRVELAMIWYVLAVSECLNGGLLHVALHRHRFLLNVRVALANPRNSIVAVSSC